MRLRYYQENGKRKIYDAWNTSDDLVCLHDPTGSGKTVLFSDIIRDAMIAGERTMMIAHREKLIMQAYEKLLRYKVMSGIIMGSRPTHYERPSQICSIQTIARRKNLPPVDKIIIDEGHHVTDDNTYGRILQQIYPKAKVLIVSASFYRLSGDGFNNIVPGRNSRLIINGTTKERIDDGWLVPFKYYAYAPDMTGVHKRGGDWQEDEARKAMDLAPIVESYMDHAKGKQGITFGVNVQHCLDMQTRYDAAGVPCAVVSSDTSDDDRRQIISDYVCGFNKIVINCDIYTEGADFPFCQFVQDAAPTMSLSKYLQRAGRGTRAEEGLVDQYATADMRRAAIALSSKPHNIILDNAGNFQTHMFPDHDHDWNMYFNGTRGDKREKKEQEMMEILVFVAEDENGKIVKTRSPKEIEGMRLIEITKEFKQSFVKITALKQFDRIYDTMLIDLRPYPAHRAINTYIAECRKTNTFISEEMWAYFETRCIINIQGEIDTLARNQANNPKMPASFYETTIKKKRGQAVATTWLANAKREYMESLKQTKMF